MDGVTDVIEAFADGEAVDPGALRQALALEAGREHLIDVLTLRAMVSGEVVSRPMLSGPTSQTGTRLAWSRWIPAAAAVLVIGGITGYVAGSRAASDTSSQAANAVVAPAPTQVIQLRQGVDWTERAGGH